MLLEFRIGCHETDKDLIAKNIQNAADGVTYMRTYSRQHNPDPLTNFNDINSINVDLAATQSQMGSSQYTPDLRPPNWRAWRRMARGDMKSKQ
jgi:hypothetical protein